MNGVNNGVKYQQGNSSGVMPVPDEENQRKDSATAFADNPGPDLLTRATECALNQLSSGIVFSQTGKLMGNGISMLLQAVNMKDKHSDDHKDIYLFVLGSALTIFPLFSAGYYCYIKGQEYKGTLSRLGFVGKALVETGFVAYCNFRIRT